MGIPTDTVFEVRTTGSDTQCGGGWSNANKGATGTDFTQQNSAQHTFSATLSGSGTTTLTDSGNGFLNTYLGNLIQITGQGTYCITGFTDTGHVTVDRSLGTFSGGTGYVGGAFATPGQACSVIPSSWVGTTYIKSGTYLNSSNSNNVAGGRISTGALSPGTGWAFVGYNTNRIPFNTDSTRTIIQANTGSFVIFQASSNGLVSNLVFDGNGNTGNTGLNSGGAGVHSWNCKALSLATGFSMGSNCLVENGEVSGTLASGVGYQDSGGSGCFFAFCTVHSTTTGVTGFNLSGSSSLLRCAMYSTNSTNTFVTISGSQCAVYDCVGYCTNQTTTKGINITGGVAQTVVNCTMYGYDKNYLIAANGQLAVFVNCAEGNHSTAGFSGITANQQVGSITLTADPFTSASGFDFSLNNTAGGGALLRSAGYPTAWPGFSTASKFDVGLAQRDATQTQGGCPIVGSPIVSTELCEA